MSYDYDKIKSEQVKVLLDEIECLKPKKRKHIDFLPARWIYQIDDTDIYLIYLTGYSDKNRCREYYDYDKKCYVMALNGWVWHKVKRNHFGEIKTVDRIDFYNVMDDLNIPTEILFHINQLSLLKASDEKDFLLKK